MNVMADSRIGEFNGREPDKEWLRELSNEALVDVLFMHIRDLFAVDGLYFLGIERRFGSEAAVEIDTRVWENMAKIEVRRLVKTMGVSGADIPSFMQALRSCSWSLDTEKKEIMVEENRGIYRNTKCRVQTRRAEKGLKEFPCKGVRYNWLKLFAKELNPKIKVNCITCPPDDHPDDLWCEWEFVMEE
jgi:hypothetical protein